VAGLVCTTPNNLRDRHVSVSGSPAIAGDS
jgi:hypothetical protein